MKKYPILFVGCLILVGSSVMAEPSATDQKWLTIVQKMVAEGKTSISTPSEDRVKLAKDWAAQQGLAVEVTKKEASYAIEFQKKVAKN
ncbi:MAG: hypothetical protein PCFJNLEI_00330 [Verrucomicrobiae bacterium]|nr:hypothetical protein [Verrucomicrobiae bacterium]